MKTLIAYFSRADENYFAGQLRYIEVGNTERAAKMLGQITTPKITTHVLKRLAPISKIKLDPN